LVLEDKINFIQLSITFICRRSRRNLKVRI
jgi:hypothetical protein